MSVPRPSRGRMKGGVSLLTFFAQAKKVSRPEGAKPEVSEHSEIGSEPDSLDATRGSLSGPWHYPDFIRATRGKKRARPGPGSRLRRSEGDSGAGGQQGLGLLGGYFTDDQDRRALELKVAGGLLHAGQGAAALTLLR